MADELATGHMETVYPAADGGPDVRLIAHGPHVRTADLTPPDAVPADKWREFGQALLGFHHRVAISATCRCGRTVVECDVQHHARRLGLLSPL